MGERSMKSNIIQKIILITVIISLIITNSLPAEDTNQSITQEIIYKNTLFVGGTGSGNYSTIESAIENASDGDTIFVFNGIYSLEEKLIIDKEVSLIGENNTFTIVKSINDLSILLHANNILLKDFLFINTTITCTGENVTINHNHFQIIHNTYNYGSSTIKIMNNNNVVSNNVIIFSDVAFLYNWNAIGIFGSSCNIVLNKISFKDYTVGYTCCAIFLNEAYQCSVNSNLITGSPTYGILVDDFAYIVLDSDIVGQNVIKDNVVSNCTYGIYYHPCLVKAYRSMIMSNTLLNNTCNAEFYTYVLSLECIIRLLLPDDDDSGMYSYGMSTMANSFGFHRVWQGNYYDDYDGTGPYVIKGIIMLRGFLEVFPGFSVNWMDVDLHPAEVPCDSFLGMK